MVKLTDSPEVLFICKKTLVTVLVNHRVVRTVMPQLPLLVHTDPHHWSLRCSLIQVIPGQAHWRCRCLCQWSIAWKSRHNLAPTGTFAVSVSLVSLSLGCVQRKPLRAWLFLTEVSEKGSFTFPRAMVISKHVVSGKADSDSLKDWVISQLFVTFLTTELTQILGLFLYCSLPPGGNMDALASCPFCNVLLLSYTWHSKHTVKKKIHSPLKVQHFPVTKMP